MEFVTYPDREMLILKLTKYLADDLKRALVQKNDVSFAVPGGTTPGPIFDNLSAIDLEWDRVHIMLGDERWVPENHERSNTRLLRQRMLQNRAQLANLIPLYADYANPEQGLEHVMQGVRDHLPLDVVLLGMGADMHTASIFPGADQLELALSDNAPELIAMRAPNAPEPRITLSARVINDAMAKHIVIFGQEKYDAFEQAKKLTPKEAPIRAVLDDSVIHWAP